MSCGVIVAQTITQKIPWQNVFLDLNADLATTKTCYFTGAFFDTNYTDIPFLYENIKTINTNEENTVSLINFTTTPLSSEEKNLLQKITHYPKDLELSVIKVPSGNTTFLILKAYPLYQTAMGWQKVNSITYQIQAKNTHREVNTKPSKFLKSSSTSPLASGTWHKIAVTKDGMYSINRNQLAAMGINVNQIDPRNIQLFGNGIGLLPESLNPSDYPESIQEIPIIVEGENDGSFDANDRIIFFGKGPDEIQYNPSEDFITYQKNYYADSAYYFLHIGNTLGKRVSNYTETLPATQNITTYTDIFHYEINTVNLIQSGKEWFGEYFDITTTRNFNFNLGVNLSNSPSKIKVSTAVRSFTTANNQVIVTVNNGPAVNSGNISAVGNTYTSIYARRNNLFVNQALTSNTNVSIRFNKALPSSVAWLDYITLNVPKNLTFNNSPILVQNPSTISEDAVDEYIVNTSSSIQVWEITKAYDIKNLNVENTGNTKRFRGKNDVLKRYAIHNGNNYQNVVYMGKINNQNLLSLINRDYLIICPQSFNPQAQRLANFHQQHHNYSTAIVSLNQIYTEFSSGNQDITAIRNFLKYLYKNSNENNKLKHVFFLGDASYDYKNVLVGNTNLVPTYQSDESFSPLSSFSSDDYFGIFTPGASIYTIAGALSVGIGRYPAKSISEAQNFVDKVIRYCKSPQNQLINQVPIPSTHHPWKNEMLFVADDGNDADGFTNAHFEQTEFLVNNILAVDSSFNVKKIYLDAYPKEGSAGGGKYPDVTRDINNWINQGVFIASYIGHGGEAGWADERILEIRDITRWNNLDKLPLFVTATCEFSRFDNPQRISAGEEVILNPNGGAIAMLTTVRLVFGGISNNIGFSRNFFTQSLERNNGKVRTLGEAFMNTKNISPMGSSFNNRKFALLGDPGIPLAVPEYYVTTTSVKNDFEIDIDTLNALSKVSISGEIQDYNGNLLPNFNGVIYPTVLDKKRVVFTRDNNNRNRVDSFYVYDNILFKGKASVNNGKFTFEFILPKDIDYRFGKGRVSYYASAQDKDANGYNQEIIIGGTNPNAQEDKEPPLVELFINDTTFVPGGLSDENPLVIAHISDNTGINITGNGIGRNMTLTLNEDVANSIVVNDFFRSNIDSYKSGKVEYPLNDLAEGNYQLNLKAWDIHNNSGESSVEFIVSNSANLQLKNLLNYPNPFTTFTDFMFEHNQPGSTLDVHIAVLTVTGRIVKNIHTQIANSVSFSDNKIPWDGLDDFGNQIGRGTYIYRITVKTSSGLQTHAAEKLVLLR